MEDEELLARLQERQNALIEKMGAHEKLDEDRFERTFNFVKQMKEEILNNIDDVKTDTQNTNSKVGTLWDDMNTRKGAIKMGSWLAGGAGSLLGGLLVAALDWLAKK